MLPLQGVFWYGSAFISKEMLFVHLYIHGAADGYAYTQGDAVGLMICCPVRALLVFLFWLKAIYTINLGHRPRN